MTAELPREESGLGMTMPAHSTCQRRRLRNAEKLSLCSPVVSRRSGRDRRVFLLLKREIMLRDADDVVCNGVVRVSVVAPLTFRTSFLSAWEEKKPIRSGTIPQTHTWSPP